MAVHTDLFTTPLSEYTCLGIRGRTFGLALAAPPDLVLPVRGKVPLGGPTVAGEQWAGSTHVKHISRNKLIKKKPSQTVTATPEKLKGGAVRGERLCLSMFFRWAERAWGTEFTIQLSTVCVLGSEHLLLIWFVEENSWPFCPWGVSLQPASPLACLSLQ